MFAGSMTSRARRRGIVLVVILGMLGLLALIGVTFATFSNQAQINARNWSLAQMFPDASEMMDYALTQLIEDTANPASVIRGHSLKRDMYGNDAVYNGGPLSSLADGTPLQVQNAQIITTGPRAGMIELTTNIPSNNASSAFYTYDFTRWTIRFPAASEVDPANIPNPPNNPVAWVARSHEILVDDAVSNNNYRLFYIPIPDQALYAAMSGSGLTNVPAADPKIAGYLSSDLVNPPSNGRWTSTLNNLPGIIPNSSRMNFLPAAIRNFVLDGRYLHAFNGAGVGGMSGYRAGNGAVANGLDTSMLSNVYSGTMPLGRPLTELGNFRYNGNIFKNVVDGYVAVSNSTSYSPDFRPTFGDPNDSNYIPGMDEDYDACDLENWFLAIQSADGQVVIPSFHRPGILSSNPNNVNDNDWTRTTAQATNSAEMLLATRAMSRILRPRAADGHSPISFPNLTPDPTTGKIKYDVDNDGDGVTDSVWLDLGYPSKRSPEGKLFKPLFSFMVLGLNGRLPLNTAGNLQKRNNQNQPTHDHADHLGNSPSEIDLRFALQNAFDRNSPNTYTQFDDAGGLGMQSNDPSGGGVSVAITQLRNLLAGTRPYVEGLNMDSNVVNAGQDNPVNLPNGVGDQRDLQVMGGTSAPVYRTTQAVPGRFGEEDSVPGIPYNPVPAPPASGNSPYNNYVRAGQSAVSGSTSLSAMDARDDNYNGFDFNGEQNDTYDGAGQINLPVERIRRFASPLDLDGNGRVITYNKLPYNSTTNDGADAFGRVSYYRYFRPAGIPSATASPTSYATSQPYIPDPINAALGSVWFDGVTNFYDTRTNNPYRGFLSLLTPISPPSGPTLMLAAMPSDTYSATTGTPGPITQTTPTVSPPTYTSTVNTQANSAALNEADEMDLYSPTRVDAPFGPSDLEWLYRFQDVDGASLQSRLPSLAPISFLNPLDGSKRRRLFSLESWELNRFVWANDNPQNVFASNSRFTWAANSSFQNVNLGVGFDKSTGSVSRVLPGSPVNTNTLMAVDPAADFSPQVGNTQPQPPYNANNRGKFNVPTPAVAHGQKKINLNFPLPVSNSPIEPLRQKWIRETYQLLKATLPPKAVDTPEELAALSQYVVNIIDFRDPDATTTRFINTDVWVNEPNGLDGRVTLGYPATAAGIAYDPVANLPAPGTPGHYLVQYGMEYQPVAINEVLAFAHQWKNTRQTTSTVPAANQRAQMTVELVNMLTKDALPEGTGHDASNLDLRNWDFVVLPDDGYGRPDPYTGQIPLMQPNATPPSNNVPWSHGPQVMSVPLAGGDPASNHEGAPNYAQNAGPGTGITPQPPAALGGSVGNPDVPAAAGQVYYFLFGNEPPPLTSPDDTKTPTGINLPRPTAGVKTGYVDLTAMLYQNRATPKPASDFPASMTADKLNPGFYYWLYLRRPANPFDTSVNAEKVVVDSFRFAFLKSKGVAHSIDNPPPPQKKRDVYDTDPTGEYIFSLQRVQPFRGGHAIPPLVLGSGSPTASVVTIPTFLPSYGYTEQTMPGPSGTNAFGYFGDATDYENPSSPLKITGEIRHTLGKPNSATNANLTTANTTASETRDYLVFNDRDFTSVVELMLVPGCSPGLFTKQFVENAPPIAASLRELRAVTYPIISATTDGQVGPLNTEYTGGTAYWANSTWQKNNAPTLFTGNRGSHSFPYLKDQFFYTGSSEPATWVQGESGTPNFFRSAANSNYVGGPGSNGWYKMFDFFEVPSPAFKAIGPVASGTNYDWARQDLRAGLLNLNLIVDEEVFLGLIGESLYGNPYDYNDRAGVMNQTQLQDPQTPIVITEVDDNGRPTTRGQFRIPNTGAFDTYKYTDPATGNEVTVTDNRMKGCFADFLNLRHGGTNHLFGWGVGANGSFNTGGALDMERPYHSLSFPDINYTVMRPAASPPAPTAVTPAYPWVTGTALTDTTATTITWDPGLKNPFLFATSTLRTVVQPPAIPPRRLFQIPDAWGSEFKNGAWSQPSGSPSNASVPGDPRVNTQVYGVNLFNPSNELTRRPYKDAMGNDDMSTSIYLGGRHYNNGSTPYDQRDHPYFRTEWLQKMVNLTTVRTHQYAVWITVGFFEVLEQGNPSLAASDPTRAYDKLGLELGVLDGKNRRYRGFFLVDRTRATGFNPAQPGDFRACVVHRQIIE